VPVAIAAAAVGIVRFALWGGERPAWQAILELATFAVVCAAATWRVERPLLREAASQGEFFPTKAAASA
jgi:hypothetical protein